MTNLAILSVVAGVVLGVAAVSIVVLIGEEVEAFVQVVRGDSVS